MKKKSSTKTFKCKFRLREEKNSFHFPSRGNFFSLFAFSLNFTFDYTLTRYIHTHKKRKGKGKKFSQKENKCFSSPRSVSTTNTIKICITREQLVDLTLHKTMRFLSSFSLLSFFFFITTVI